MRQTGYYRYVGEAELAYISATREIRSLSAVTHFTPDRYDDPDEAQRFLALERRPQFRLGPIPEDEMPEFDAVPLRDVEFKGPGRPGGGTEVATTATVSLFGVYDLESRRFMGA